MAKNKREFDVAIDEAALLQSIYEQDKPLEIKQQPTEQEKPEQELPEPAKEQPEKPKEPKRKRNHADYSSIFLQRNELKERSSVYISRRIHSTITEIVRVIADKDVTVGGYIDSVLLQHLEVHKEEINNLYKRERKDLIEF